MAEFLDRVGELYQRDIVDTGKVPQFLILISFLLAFLAVREAPAAGGPGVRFQGAIAARERMMEELRALLPADLAERLIALYPAPPATGPADGETPGGGAAAD